MVEGKLSEACHLCDRLEQVPAVAVISTVARIWMSLAGCVGKKHAGASVCFQGLQGYALFCLHSLAWVPSLGL